MPAKSDAKPKSLLIILLFLMLLLLSVGVINYYYVREIDKSYSVLIEETMQSTVTLQEITRNSTKMRSRIKDLLKTEIPAERERYKKDINELMIANNRNFDNLDSLSKSNLHIPKLHHLVQARMDFLATKDSLFNMLDVYPIPICSTYYAQQVRPRIEAYNDEQLAYVYQIKYAAYENSDMISNLSLRISRITFGLIFAPVILIVIGIFYIMLILYNNIRDNEDTL